MLEEITKAVENFNNSPWIDLGTKLVLEDEIERAKVKGIKTVLEEIRREDIRLFHKEEGLCGCI